MTFIKGHKDFISKSKRRNVNYRKRLSNKAKIRGNCGNGFKIGHQLGIGDKNGLWRGNEVSYAGLHIWVKKWKGKPKNCGVCGSEGKSKYQWANIDHKYRRVLEDYISMCPSCHKKYDIKMFKKVRPLRETVVRLPTNFGQLK